MEIFSFAILILCSIHLTRATHILLPGESLYPNQTLVSQNGQFGLGFYSLRGKHYIAIWLISAKSKTLDGTTVWVGNRENPVDISQPCALSLSRNGDVILTQSQKLIWSTNLTQTHQQVGNGTVLDLLDTGNLVLREDDGNSSKVIWQSFDLPDNTWLPGAWLGTSNINGKNILFSLTAWASDGLNPSVGNYTLEVQQVSGTWGFNLMQAQGVTKQYVSLPPFLPIIQNDIDHGLITIKSSQFRVTISSGGQIIIWNGDLEIYDNPCYQICGPFGVCITPRLSYFSSCQCLYGFQPKSSQDFALQIYGGGCVRNYSWDCTANSSLDPNKFTFHLQENLLYVPNEDEQFNVRIQKECEIACLNNCSCTTYSYVEEAPGLGRCSLWYKELSGMYIDETMSSDVPYYIRLLTSNSMTNFNTNKKTHNKQMKLIIGGVSCFVLMSLLFLWIFRGKLLCAHEVANVDDYLSIYTYSQIKYATKKFSTKLGEGGFGCVFKGKLFNGTDVAVKKLKIAGQEEKQFRAEVQTLGMIQHTNLVRLLGFCAEGTKRLLVYEYMANGSLSSHLFSTGSTVLSWKERYQIALGIARGLAYLHEHCIDCIIHCDIKPENVLLDENFSPKIADFGMAKLLGRDFSRALTTFRGTIGYLAPEWYSGNAITEKADVYSFGMMLFEIISGRRNASKFNNTRYPYFPLYATIKMNEGEALCSLDEKLGGSVNVVELIRACKVAGWCIQESEERRPSMAKVVNVLQGVTDVGIPPVPSSLLNLVDAEEY